MKAEALSLMVWLSAALATSPAPYYFQNSLIDRVAAAARPENPAATAALEVLIRIAEAKMDTAAPDLEQRVGLEPGQLRKPEFRAEMVRSHALRKIGELDLSGALSYLRNLKRSDVELDDRSGMVWTSAQIAIHEAQWKRIPDESEKTRFLEKTAVGGSAADHWAVEKLCDAGSYQSLSAIRESITRRIPSRADEDIAFCEARIRVMSSNPDPVRALGSALSVDNRIADRKLVGWAIVRLNDIGTTAADTELDRYVREIQSLQDGSAVKAAVSGDLVTIRNLRDFRPRRGQ